MKKTILFALLLVTLSSFAQQNINYKALIRDNSGNPILNQAITVEFDILANGNTSVYKEQHSPTTDANGLIILNIGNGTLLSGDFNTIDWASTPHFLNTKIDTGNGLTDMGTTEFMAVPYAKHATTATIALNAGATRINDLIDGKTTISSSLYLGSNAGALDITGSSNSSVGVGFSALANNTTGNRNTAIGGFTLLDNTIGNNNTAIGSRALLHNTTGNNNTATGTSALSSNTTGDSNTAMGAAALSSNTTGSKNTAIGNSALSDNTTGVSNTATGSRALLHNTTGNSNTATGLNALFNNTTGGTNTATGFISLSSNTTGIANTAIGTSALRSNTTGNSNTAIGSAALRDNITGGNNTVIGVSALANNTTGSNNIAIGHSAGNNETGSNKLYIESSSTSTPLIYGEFDTNKLEINGTLKVKEGTDASLSNGSGFFMIGVESERNLIMDNNEIMARNNGSTSNLHLQVDGGSVFVGGSLVHSSDRRLKKNITSLKYGLSEILALEPKSYNWKNRKQKYKSLGLIAQEVQPIIKEIVLEQEDKKKTLAIDYTSLIPILINAIKEQQVQINNLKKNSKAQEAMLLKYVERIENNTKITVETLNN